MKPTVVLIDDDPVDLQAWRMMLDSWDLQVLPARSGAQGIEIVEKEGADLVVSDVCMPGMSGEDVVRTIKEKFRDIPVVLMTGQGDVKSAVRAMKLGAFDYVLKPPDEEELRLAVTRAMEHAQLTKQNRFLQAQMAVGGAYGERLIGDSPAMQEVFNLVRRVARTDSTVLITGETGTGKDVVAQTLHYQSMRADHPLVCLNCAALNANLIESELFGHEKGAFTGAVTARRGRFEDADGGTLFLDEIGETTPEFQSKLLRVLQDGVFERVGGSKPLKANVRLIASTNRNLEEAVEKGKFRQDLYYRLNVIRIHMPPLRERGRDIVLLAGYFVRVYGDRYQGRVKSLSAAAEQHLTGREWRGNVRELRHAVERAVVLSSRDILEPDDFRTAERAAGAAADGTLQAVLDARSREYLLTVLDRTGWNKQAAADILGIDRATLWRMLKKFSIDR